MSTQNTFNIEQEVLNEIEALQNAMYQEILEKLNKKISGGESGKVYYVNQMRYTSPDDPWEMTELEEAYQSCERDIFHGTKELERHLKKCPEDFRKEAVYKISENYSSELRKILYEDIGEENYRKYPRYYAMKWPYIQILADRIHLLRDYHKTL